MRYATWTFEIESRERPVVGETLCSENSDIGTNTKSVGTPQISNQFATVSPHQAIVPDQKVVTVQSKSRMIVRTAVEEFD
jgi:hypothetical protein